MRAFLRVDVDARRVLSVAASGGENSLANNALNGLGVAVFNAIRSAILRSLARSDMERAEHFGEPLSRSIRVACGGANYARLVSSNDAA